MAAQNTWKPHDSLTKAPTNLKEAIDWVLRVTGKDGKKNVAASPPGSTNNGPHCLCYLAKAIKDLLYDARSAEYPGPSTQRYWSDILLPEESTIVKPVLQDLGLLSTGSTTSSCAGGTEVIKALIDQLALGLQKWVGWQEKGDDCCLKGEDGIGKACDCPGGGGVDCCTGSGTSSTTCHDCTQCGTKATSGTDKKCYLSAYCKPKDPPGSSTTDYYWPTISSDPEKVHLLARIFLGSVCLIWSGLSQLGFLTKEGSGGTERWSKGTLSSESDNLGSFMAAMGYDLERLNGSGQGNVKNGDFVWKLLSGQKPDEENKRIKWQEFHSVKDKLGDSVAEYYSSIYSAAEKDKKTEDICKQYPLLVLHILASGYFRAGSAGANKIPVTPPKAAPSTSKTPSSDTKKDDKPRHPRTIREILYWLSALPYSQGYCQLVGRMGDKTDMVTKGELKLHGEGDKTTDLKKDCITHYLMAACGYCPLVLIGIQGTIEREVKTELAAGPAAAAAEKQPCPNYGKKEEEKTDCDNEKKLTKQGQVCYRGYHMDVKDFGPLHGMYANGLFGFEMDISPAQCLDQLRIYVYHCFYQLYFLRKQCSTGVATDKKTVLGWKSCRYGKDVKLNSSPWSCSVGTPGVGQDCQCKKSESPQSPLMSFLCDGPGKMVCNETIGKGVDDYPPIETHWTTKDDNPPGHFGTEKLSYPKLCPVPMGWSSETGKGTTQTRVNHFKDLNTGSHKQASLTGGSPSPGTYPAHCTGKTLSHLLEYYCDPVHCHGTLVVLLRLLACITPTVPQTLGDLFGFYYYIVYIGGNQGGGGGKEVHEKLGDLEREVVLYMGKDNAVVKALETYSGDCNTGTQGTLKCLVDCTKGGPGQCSPYLSPLSGQQYGQLSPLMAGTYLSWLVYLIGEFQKGLEGLEMAFKKVDCKGDGCGTGAAGGAAAGCSGTTCTKGNHGDPSKCCGCDSVVSCTGVLPVLYKYGFGYGDVSKLHTNGGQKKQCHMFLETLNSVLKGNHIKHNGKGLHHEINQLIYTTRLPWIFVLTLAWLVAVLYLAFGAIWPLDWTHMRSHCRGWFRKGSLSPWEVLMVGKKKGRGILEFFGKT